MMECSVACANNSPETAISGSQKPDYEPILALASVGKASHGLVIFVFFVSVIAKVFFLPRRSEYSTGKSMGPAAGLLTRGVTSWLAETALFRELRSKGRSSRELPLRVVVRHHAQAFIASACTTYLMTGSIVVVLLMTPTLLLRSSGASIRPM
jgi:hypothetical protein